MSGDDSKYDGVLGALRDINIAWQEYQKQLSAEILEYKKTVNSALSILGMEAVKFQNDTRDRLTTDAAERLSRQQFVDNEAARRDEADKERRKEATAEHAAFQTRANRERLGIMGAMGCLVFVNITALIVLAIVLIVQNWK
jgi:hypothetical protein